MITVKQLKDLVHVYQKKAVDFSLEIDAEILEIIRIESDYTFSLFAQFIDKDDDSVLSASTVKEIRDYFKTRWKVLKNNNLAYTRFPFLPVNQFCLKVAEGIARPGEAVCTILMPSLLGLNRLASSLKFETEDDGHFKLEDYIVNQDYTKLIPIREIFEYAALNSDYVLPDFQPADAQLKYQLGGRDFVNLEEVTGEASQRFIRTLKQHHTRRYDNNSLGFAIKRLATELRKSSKSDAGNEQLADNKALGDAVHVFHNLWSELSPDLSLPQETNAAPIEILVKDLKLKSYGYGQATLESYLLCLFFI